MPLLHQLYTLMKGVNVLFSASHSALFLEFPFVQKPVQGDPCRKKYHRYAVFLAGYKRSFHGAYCLIGYRVAGRLVLNNYTDNSLMKIMTFYKGEVYKVPLRTERGFASRLG